MIDHETLNEALSTAGLAAGLWLLRRVTISLRQMVVEFQTLRELPNRMEAALRDLTERFDERMTLNERRQEILETQFRVVVDRLLQHEEEARRE